MPFVSVTDHGRLLNEEWAKGWLVFCLSAVYYGLVQQSQFVGEEVLRGLVRFVHNFASRRGCVNDNEKFKSQRYGTPFFMF